VQEVDKPTTDRTLPGVRTHFGLFQACREMVRRVIEPESHRDYVDMAFAMLPVGGRAYRTSLAG